MNLSRAAIGRTSLPSQPFPIKAHQGEASRGLPTRRELVGTALGIIFATMALTTLNVLFFLRWWVPAPRVGSGLPRIWLRATLDFDALHQILVLFWSANNCVIKHLARLIFGRPIDYAKRCRNG